MKASIVDRANFDGGQPGHRVVDPVGRTAHVAVLFILAPHGLLDADEGVATARRAISRIALVAAGTGGWSRREVDEHGSTAWLTAPRPVVDRRAIAETHQGRGDCARGMPATGLVLRRDKDRSALAGLISGGDDDVAAGPHAFPRVRGMALGGGPRPGRDGAGRSTRLGLYTATLADTRDNLLTQAFHASVARSAAEVRARLAGRFGPDLAGMADIRPGVHAAMPLVVALVPVAALELIQRMERDAGSVAARTFAVDVQQCIQA